MSETGKSADTRLDPHRYDDMLDLPHHVSETRPRMPIADRAAQFSPFRALTGYEAAVAETSRLTEERIELDESGKAVLAEKLRIVLERISDRPEITVTYFQPDRKKAGGAYVETTGTVKKLDEYARVIQMEDGTRIPIDEIIEITGALVQFLDDHE